MMNVIRTASELLAELERRQRPVGNLSNAARQILAIIEDEPLAPHVIVERMLVTSGTMTSLLDTLERRGLIERISHPDDRRKILVRITDAGRDVLDAVLPRVHALSREAFSGLSKREQQELVRVLTRVRGRVGELREQEPDAGLGRKKTRPT